MTRDNDDLDSDLVPSRFEPLVHELRREAELRGGGEHLDPGRVDAYRAGLMPPRILEATRWHVAGCSTCAEMILEVGIDESLKEAVEEKEPEPLPDGLLDGIRERIRSEVHADDKDVPPRPERPRPGRWNQWFQHPGLGWAAAAVLAVVAFAPLIGGGGLPSLVLHDLALDPQRTSAEPFVLRRSAEDALSVLVVTVNIFDPDGRFEVTLREENTGRQEFASERVLQSGPDRFALALARSQFPAGVYQLEVTMIRGDGRRQELPPMTVEILDALAAPPTDAP